MNAPQSRRPKGRLFHQTPAWVPSGETFHIRLRCTIQGQTELTDQTVAPGLLRSVQHYHETERWWCRLFLLMPDHVHALLIFPEAPGMSATIRQWKAYQARYYAIAWQSGYFDHRIRGDTQFDLKAAYIRQNPVAKGLCESAKNWPWVFEAE